MQGTVLSYSDNEGKGLISGDDGERYSFTRADLQQLKPVEAGMRVDFRKDDETAREIFLIDQPATAEPAAAQSAAAPQTAPASPSVAPLVMAVQDGHPSTKHHVGVWGYFKKCMGMYINANGRATRGEYWSFVLFCWIFLLAPTILGLAIAGGDFYQYGDDPSAGAIVLWLLAGLAYLVFIIPSITVMIRRIHDLGLSGWLVLLGFIPYVGGLVLFVMSLVPGQKGSNKHGPDPQASKPGYVAPAAA